MAEEFMTKDQHMAAHGQARSMHDEWENAQFSVSPLTRAKIKADAIDLMAAIVKALHAEHGSCIDMMNDECETIWATIAIQMASREQKPGPN